jgi:gas vesicle protein
MSKGKIALGAVVGAVAGVIAGFLTAPKSGKETRADLKRKAGELKKEAEKRTKEL